MKKFARWALALGLCLALVVCGALADEAPAIHVQLDGQELAFTDAAPQVKDQRTFLPFRAVFEAMGAQVDYEGSVITAVRDGKTLTMTLDQAAATVTEDGKTTTITMDVAPYVDSASWRTYVPVRFAAQAFGCVVGWDQAASTAIIIDTDKLMDAALEGKHFTYLDKMMELDGKYDAGIWDMTSDFDADMTVMAMPMSMSGTVTGTTQDAEKMSMDMSMKIDMDQFIAAVAQLGGEPLTAEDQAMLDALKTDGVTMTMRGDMAQGKLYMNMDMGALSAQSGFDANTWYQLDMAAMMETLGMDWAELMSDAKDMDPLTTVKTVISLLEPDDAANDYALLKKMLDDLAVALSDEGFTLVDGQQVTTYTLEEGGVSMTLAVVLELDGENVKAYSMAMNMAAQAEGQNVEFSMTVGLDDQDNMQAEMNMDMAGLLTMDMTMEGKYTAGTTAPVTTPPEGATVVDYMELLKAQMGESDSLGVIGGADGPTSIVVSGLTA